MVAHVVLCLNKSMYKCVVSILVKEVLNTVCTLLSSKEGSIRLKETVEVRVLLAILLQVYQKI